MNKELLRTIKFTLFSISAGIIEIVLFTLLDSFTNMPYWPCYLIALIASVICFKYSGVKYKCNWLLTSPFLFLNVMVLFPLLF